MYVCRRPMPSATGPLYPPSSRRDILRWIHESTAKVAIFANLCKHLSVFFSNQTCRLRFFLAFSLYCNTIWGEILCPSLISCFGISIQAAPLLSAIHAFTCQIVNSMRKSPIARQEKEGNVQTLRRKLYLCSNIRVLYSHRDIHIWAGCKVTCRFACEKEVIMFTF